MAHRFSGIPLPLNVGRVINPPLQMPTPVENTVSGGASFDKLRMSGTVNNPLINKTRSW